MGSFNETCALSNLNISPGTPVRLLFLSRNPYVVSDQRYDHRGCYHTDQWYVRTPPIKGEYADYGDCEFKESPITELIAKVFDRDVIEQPFGFNQYHTGPTIKGRGIHHYIGAAWQGRLLLGDDADQPRGDDGRRQPWPEPPENWPTWQRVHGIFKKAKLPLQIDGDGEGNEGYNAQPVAPGVVCVTFNSYGDHKKKYEKAIKVLDPHYDAKVVQMYPDRPDYDTCVLVAPKGAFDNPVLIFDEDKAKQLLNKHPQYREKRRQLPCLAVMVREDAWQAYATVTCHKKYDHYNSPPKSVDHIYDAIKRKFELKKKKHETGNPELDEVLDRCEMDFRDFMFSLPFQTTPSTHLAATPYDFPEKEELLRSCAELARIEIVMAHLHQPWYIPPLGGQDGEWGLQTALRTKILAIAKKERDEDHAEYEKYK